MTVAVFTALRRATPGQRLALALLMSLLVHALLYGGWQLGRQLGWKELPLPKWLIGVHAHSCGRRIFVTACGDVGRFRYVTTVPVRFWR